MYLAIMDTSLNPSVSGKANKFTGNTKVSRKGLPPLAEDDRHSRNYINKKAQGHERLSKHQKPAGGSTEKEEASDPKLDGIVESIVPARIGNHSG